MPTVTGEGVLHLEDIQLLGEGFEFSAQTRWFAIAEFQFDNPGTKYHSSVKITHPTRDYTGRVLDWGTLELSVAVPAGMPQISGGQIRVADTDGTLRDLLANQTPRRRPIVLKLVQEGKSESSYPVFYRGEFEAHEKGAGYVQLAFKDITFAWLDDQITGLINRENFPELEEGIDEAFLPIINGINVSLGANPSGVIPCPHIAFTTFDRYGLAQHPVASLVAVYRKRPDEGTFTLVSASEYTLTEEARTIENVDYNLSFIDFTAQQTAGTLISADVYGIADRGSWNGFPAVSGSPLRNPIDFFINMSFLIFTKAGLPSNFAAGHIMQIRERFEALAIYCDGCLTRPISVREFFGQFLPSFNLQMFQNRQGQIDLAWIENEDTARPLFSERRFIGQNSFREYVASPTVNLARYNYEQNYVTGQFAKKKTKENTADQDALGEVEDDTVALMFVRDDATALYVITQRMRYQGLGSYRQEFTLPLPEVATQIELMRQVGITHHDGMAAGDGYVDQEVVITNILVDLGRFTARLKSIRRVPATIDQSVTHSAEASLDLGNIELLAEASVMCCTETFEDLFTRADSSDIGNTWIYQTVRLTGNDAYVGAVLSASKLTWAHSGGSNLTANIGTFHPRAFASPLDNCLYGQAQYAEMTFVSSLGGATISEAGIACFLRWDYGNQQCYWLGVLDNAGTRKARLIARLGTAETVLLDNISIANGDRFRLEVTPGSPNHTVRALQNDVEIFNSTNSTLEAKGVPGIASGQNFNLAGGQTWDSFDGGVL